MVQTRYRKSEEIQLRILDVAEELFANKGFEATSVRDITGAAGVRGASVNYYFSTKRALAIEVVRRRLEQLMALREERLEKVDLNTGSAEERVKRVVDAFVSPLAELTQEGGAVWASYNSIVAQLILEKEHPVHEFADQVDATALKFISALAAIFPERTLGDAAQAFRFMLGAVAVAICESDRFSRLEVVAPLPPEVKDDPSRMVTFLSAGVVALLGAQS